MVMKSYWECVNPSQCYILTHGIEKTFQFNVCENTFKRKLNLKTHIITHISEKPFQLNVCEKTFKSKPNLK